MFEAFGRKAGTALEHALEGLPLPVQLDLAVLRKWGGERFTKT